jgi:DNA-binding NarL/FixJ family response regulator
MLSAAGNITVQNAYETGTALLEGLEKQRPDVLLLDVQLPDYKGQDLALIISRKYPSVRILAITSYDAPMHVKSMMRNGCKGYILKNTRLKPLIAAIEQVHAGETYIDPVLKEQMMQNMLHYKKSSGNRQPNLTSREKEILRLIIEEYTNQEIADRLFLSLRTVENHRFSLLQKLEVKNSIGLVRAAIEMGLVQ